MGQYGDHGRLRPRILGHFFGLSTDLLSANARLSFKVIGNEEKVCIDMEFKLLKSMTIRVIRTSLDLVLKHICNE